MEISTNLKPQESVLYSVDSREPQKDFSGGGTHPVGLVGKLGLGFPGKVVGRGEGRVTGAGEAPASPEWLARWAVWVCLLQSTEGSLSSPPRSAGKDGVPSGC